MSESIRTLRLSTSCHACASKCCSQPYDWVYLTEAESTAIEAATRLPPEAFSTIQENPHARVAFRVLELPCRFFDVSTGQCGIYELRPLVCRIFPFYTEPLTGHAALLPTQCGENLHFHPTDSRQGWALREFDTEISEWFSSLWSEAIERHRAGDHGRDRGSNTRTAGSP